MNHWLGLSASGAPGIRCQVVTYRDLGETTADSGLKVFPSDRIMFDCWAKLGGIRVSLGRDGLGVRMRTGHETWVTTLARGLILRRDVTHYPRGTPAWAIFESKFMRLA